MNKIIKDINDSGLTNCLCPKDQKCSCHLDLIDVDSLLKQTEILTRELQELGMDWRKETPSHDNIMPMAGAGETHLAWLYAQAVLDPRWKSAGVCNQCKLTKLVKDDPQGVESLCLCGYNFYPFA
jgi:hypothetical protein